MASRRRRRRLNEDDESQSVLEEEDNGVQDITAARSSTLDTAISGNGDDNRENRAPRVVERRLTGKRRFVADSSQYAEGAVKRLTLYNFLVYKKACAHFGPHMNMILGPNGAGKSSLLNGICLVLGGKPSTLGRQKHVKDFIRIGERKGWVEIELHPNTVIRREINSDGTSKYTINGKTSTEKALKELARGLHLQVDNLCQFLPQDRVSDFSGMNMYELLENTLKAIGELELSSDYERLKELGVSIANSRRDLERVSGKVLTLTNEKVRLEKEVVAFRQLAQLRQEIGFLKVKRLLLLVREKDEVVSKFEKECAKLDREVKEIDEKIKPSTKKISALKTRVEELMKKAQRCETSSGIVETRVKRVKEGVCEAFETYAVIVSDWNSAKSAVRSQEGTVEKLRHELEEGRLKLQNSIDSLPRPYDEMKRESQEAGRKHESFLRASENLVSRKSEVESRLNGVDRRIEMEETRLRGLDNPETKRLQKLRELNKGAFEALNILRENAIDFAGAVYEPPLVSLDIPNPEHTKVVETFVPMRDLSAFFFERTDDMNIFLEEMRDRRNLKVNAVHVGSCDSSEQLRSQPLTEELKLCGISGFVSDVFSVSTEIVKNILCRDHMLHKIPIGDGKTYEDVENICQRFGFQRIFVDDNGSPYTVMCTRSKYAGGTNTSYNPCHARGTCDFGEDSRDLIAAVQNSIDNLRDEKTRLEESLSAINPELEQNEKEAREWRRISDELESKISAISGLKRSMIAKEGECKRAEKRLEEIRQRGIAACEKSKGALEKFVRSQAPLKNHVKDLIQFIRSKWRTDVVIKEVEVEMQDAADSMATLVDEKKLKVDELAAAKRELQDAKIAKKEANEKQQRCKAVLEKELGKPIEFSDLKDLPKTIVDIDAELTVKEPRLGLGSGDVNSAVVQEYEKVSEALDRNETKKRDLERNCATLDDEFTTIFARWRPRAEHYLSKIDEHFRSYIRGIGGAGQVSLKIPEDPAWVEKYGAEILVKFRENEQLEPLSSTGHSGGERSVCTMIYMMSMQELTKVPFRCVDEINQGMDATNEKRVFEVLTSLAKDDYAQYILLTPKLIPGLEVSNSVTVLTLMRNVRTEHICWQDYMHSMGLTDRSDNSKCKHCIHERTLQGR